MMSLPLSSCCPGCQRVMVGLWMERIVLIVAEVGEFCWALGEAEKPGFSEVVGGGKNCHQNQVSGVFGWGEKPDFFGVFGLRSSIIIKTRKPDS